jgi:purine-binding chemotaxis protein CheW
MNGMESMQLPESGLAEDILARFMDQAQQEAASGLEAARQVEEKKLFHLVTFYLGREEYGVDIGCVQEIIRAADITPVPGAPGHVQGVINLRGKIIPVADLRRRFGLPAIEESEFRRIVVVELGEKRIGMLVDSVSQVIKVPAGVVEEMPEAVTTVADNYIKGVGKLENRLVIILDLNRSLLLI